VTADPFPEQFELTPGLNEDCCPLTHCQGS
jgi:hypothetical protein